MPEAIDAWWRRGVIYEVYVRSFADSDGDGVGDLDGIRSKLEYLVWLGVDAIWLTPIYPSPMADFGYDVADHRDIDPLFGTLADFDALLAEARRLGLKVLLEFVPNHTSDRHPWFLGSKSGRTNPKRDWYVWRDPAPGGGPPNNWLSVFGGGMWELDEATGQYYLHTYLKEQPDLNWRNPEVEAAMLEAMRFWLDRGVDGFRVDAISRLIKDEALRDNPPNPDYASGQPPHRRQLPVYNWDRPEVHAIVARMRRLIDGYGGLMIGEAYLPLDRVVRFYGGPGTGGDAGVGGAEPGVHFPFNFLLIGLPWEASAVRRAVAAYEAGLPAHGWPNWVLGNHDRSRVATRVGVGQTRVAAMLLLTLRGTPTIYYGDELGLTDVPVPPELVHDPREKNEPGHGLGRDPERTPMPWDDSTGAGFTTGDPWLPVGQENARRHVAGQRDDPASLLHFYRRLLRLRRDEPALHSGDYRAAEAPEGVITYLRTGGGRAFLVALNFACDSVALDLPSEVSGGRVTISTQPGRDGGRVAPRMTLRADEGVIVAGP